MKINWERVLIAGLWSELVAFVIYLGAKYAGSAQIPIDILAWFGLMFLGGMWVARKIESRFVLHGFWVGVVANILYIPLMPIDFAVHPVQATLPVQATPQRGSIVIELVIVYAIVVGLKILGSMLGAYVGGRWHKTTVSA